MKYELGNRYEAAAAAGGGFDPYDRPGAPTGYKPYGRPEEGFDPYAEYGRGSPAGNGYPRGMRAGGYPQQDEDDDFGGFTGYGYQR